jgi:hypothetical protein
MLAKVSKARGFGESMGVWENGSVGVWKYGSVEVTFGHPFMESHSPGIS